MTFRNPSDIRWKMLGIKVEGSTIVRGIEAIDEKGNSCLVYCSVGFVPLRRFCLGLVFPRATLILTRLAAACLGLLVDDGKVGTASGKMGS